MCQAIKLARQALMLFLQSIEYGSLFNVCSYGSEHNFIFPDGSVEYNEENLQQAMDLIATFEADFGGTEILTPLNEIFTTIKSRKQHSAQTHIYLLTDGAVHNT
jgi:von Willebrand factor type A domain